MAATWVQPLASRIRLTRFVVVTDYAVALDPAAPAAGRTSFVMTNQGQERHVMDLIRLEDGATLDEALASEGDEGVEQELESDFATAGEEAVLTADLASGEYALICYLPNTEGTPHFVLGMKESFTIA